MAIRYLVTIDTGDEVFRASTAVRNPLNPSDIRYSDSGGTRYAFPVRLSIPSVNHKISDSISGSIVLEQFSITLMNDDGLYDDIDNEKIFNATVTLYRSDVENATLEDFSVISSGTVDYPVISEKTLKLVVNVTYRSLTQEVCKVFSTDDYPNIPDNNEGKSIPIGYGPGLNNVPLFQIDTTDLTKYIALDPDYITGVSAVYDSDGNSISFSGPDVNGIITATDAVTADVAGSLSNRIGEIIINETQTKSAITYDSTNWELSESNIYKDTSGKLNFYFDGGSVRQLIDAVLKSDNAFFFTKNNGLLTIRQWALTYTIHNIQSWEITQFPSKDYKDAVTYYNSSVVIKYDKNISSGDYENQIIDATDEAAIIAEVGRQKRVEYEMDLYESAGLQDIATRLVTRFGELSPNISLASGFPATGIDLLDTVKINVTIGQEGNNRVFSDQLYWIVRQVNPAQDTVYLEARSGFEEPDVIQGIFSQPKTEDTGSGVLSRPISPQYAIENQTDIDGNEQVTPDGLAQKAIVLKDGDIIDGKLSQPSKVIT